MNALLTKVQDWMARRRSHGSGGLLGEPGATQRPGPSGGGPAEGPMIGGSAGPASPEEERNTQR